MSATDQEHAKLEAAMALSEARAGSDEEFPIQEDKSEFAGWLRLQVHRQDPVGALSRVAMQDPMWPGAESRQQLSQYFVKMGARRFVMQSLKRAWDEFDATKRRTANKKKRQAQKAARKRNR